MIWNLPPNVQKFNGNAIYYYLIERFATYYKMRCEKRDNGYLTDECRKIGQIDASEYTYVGYHAVESGWEEGNRYDVNLYLPIAKAGYGEDDWKGPCEYEWNYCPNH